MVAFFFATYVASFCLCLCCPRITPEAPQLLLLLLFSSCFFMSPVVLWKKKSSGDKKDAISSPIHREPPASATPAACCGHTSSQPFARLLPFFYPREGRPSFDRMSRRESHKQKHTDGGKQRAKNHRCFFLGQLLAEP